MSRNFYKTRIAPTPSGFLHLGNAFSFMITHKLAKQYNAKLLLRIDDLDRERVEKEYVEDIFATLQFLGIDWDEGPENYAEFEGKWSQMHRLTLYNDALQQLQESGHLFACTCSRTQILTDNPCRNKNLPLDTPNASWRVRTDAGIKLWVKTLEGDVLESTLPPSMQNFIVRKKDGFPAYQLSSMADDVHFGVDLIVRGRDLWDSTLAQLYLASLLGKTDFLNTTFFHHPLLEGSQGQKLSKSAGDTSIQYLRKQGVSKDEVIKQRKEFLSLLENKMNVSFP
jgi:glutamyl/glutaminyl-tRNA synthetase